MSADPIDALDLLEAVLWLPVAAPEKAVLLAMVLSRRMSRSTWTGSPAVAALAAASGYKDRRVRMALNTLEHQVRAIVRLSGREGGQHAPSEWQIAAGRIVAMAQLARTPDTSTPAPHAPLHDMHPCMTCTPAPDAYAVGDLDLDLKDPPTAPAPHAPLHDMHGSTPPAPELPPQPPPDHADPGALGEVWAQEVRNSPVELRGRIPSMAASWPTDLLMLPMADAEEAVRAVAALCRGTRDRAPCVLDWAKFFGERGRCRDAWRDALAWARGAAGEPDLGRQWIGGGSGRQPKREQISEYWARRESQREAETPQAPPSKSTTDARTAKLWEAVLVELGARMNRQQFDIWIGALHPLRLTAEGLELGIGSAYQRDWVEEHYLGAIMEILEEITVGEVKSATVTVSGGAA